MSLLRALALFLADATRSLLRGWRVSLVAILAIAASLFVGGSLLLVAANLARLARGWRGEARVVVYLAADSAAAERRALVEELQRGTWTERVEEVSPARAAERFRAAFPSLVGLLEGWDEEPLPASLEVSLVHGAPLSLGPWIEDLRRRPIVAGVDDDRDLLVQVARVIALVRAVGASVAGLLLAAAVLTIASVIRLSLLQYRDEVVTLRLVGATEFFIRGPFYAQGMLQGLLGAGAALGGLALLARALVGSAAPVAGLFADFLPAEAIGLLLAVGALAGLAGGLLSIRREGLGDEL